MLRQVVTLHLCGALVWLAGSLSARADTITAIPQPTAQYRASTTLIPFTGGGPFTSISGGGLTVTFSSSMTKLRVPDTWGTWNCPPATEVSCGGGFTPSDLPLLWTGLTVSSITMTLSTPEAVFGFEAQPDSSTVDTMTATYFGVCGCVLGSLSLDVSGNAGAKLFAVSSSTLISRIQFRDTAGGDFAIANVRFAPGQFVPTPEPVSALLLGTGLAVLVLRKWR